MTHPPFNNPLRPAPPVALLLLLSGCATMQATHPAPTLSAGPAQCLGVQAATTAWGLVDAYVRQTLEVQRAAACVPLSPTMPEQPSAPAEPPPLPPSAAPEESAHAPNG